MKSAEGDDGDGCDSRVSVLCHAFREAGVESLLEKNMTPRHINCGVFVLMQFNIFI